MTQKCNPDYRIHSTQTAPHHNLITIVKKHAFATFQKPIHRATQQAFIQAKTWCDTQHKPVILDAGCGTGKSSLHLAKSHPDHSILGIDRSNARLARLAPHDLNNVLFCRADLVDFFALAHAAHWTFEKLTLYYPNPYPKSNDITKRWHGHPIFPTLLNTSQHIEVRSNWHLYLEEFALAANTLQTCQTTLTPITTAADHAISLFEKKYLETQTPCFSLTITRT